MGLEDLGSVQGLNQSASGMLAQGASDQVAKQRVVQDAIDKGQELPNQMTLQNQQFQDQMSLQKQQQQAQLITITPQLANGAAKATDDDSWQRSVGMKMPANIYSALLTIGAKKQLAQENNQAKGEREDKALSSKKGISDSREEHADKRAEANRKNQKDIAESRKSGRGSTAEAPTDREFIKSYRDDMNKVSGLNGKLLQQSNPEEYQERNKRLQDGKDRFSKLQGDQTKGLSSGDDKKKKATDWLKQRHPELKNPTDADVQWATEHMNG